jgi:hypothetical protein
MFTRGKHINKVSLASLIFSLQFYLEDISGMRLGPREDEMDRFGGNLAHYAIRRHEMFYDFTIRSIDGGSVPANKDRNRLYGVLLFQKVFLLDLYPD